MWLRGNYSVKGVAKYKVLTADGPAVVGPMPTITDSLFSLIIFIYVMITFLYLFYGFCWVEPPKLTEEQKKELAKQVNTLSYYQLAQHSHTEILFLTVSKLGGPQSQANGSSGDDRRGRGDDGRPDGETVAKPRLWQKPFPGSGFA